jgi:hypothetical protein
MRRGTQIPYLCPVLIIKAALPHHKPGAAIIDHKGGALRSPAGHYDYAQNQSCNDVNHWPNS